LYEVAPWSVEAWGNPAETLPLAALRLVGWSRAGAAPGGGGPLVLTVRCGTARGVVQRSLRAETHRDLAAWAGALVSGAHEAVMSQKEFVFRKCEP
jgi:beta-syntrophin